MFINPERTPIQTKIYDTPHLDISLDSKPVSNKYINIVNNEIELFLLYFSTMEYQSEYVYIKHNSIQAAMITHFCNLLMATVSSFTN